MRDQIVCFGLCAALSLSPAFAQSLCKTSEVTVFTCAATPKIISVCASKVLGPRAGYVQFRIGTKSGSEVSYPSKAYRSANTGAFGYAAMDTGPPGHYLMKKAGRETYFILTTDDRGEQYGEEETAFVRTRNGKHVEGLVCDALTSPDGKGLDLLEKAGFQNIDNDALDFP